MRRHITINYGSKDFSTRYSESKLLDMLNELGIKGNLELMINNVDK